MKKKIKIVRKMTIQEVLGILGERAVPVLTKFGMHCFGCPMSRMETLEQASSVHGFEADELVDELNKLL